MSAAVGLAVREDVDGIGARARDPERLARIGEDIFEVRDMRPDRLDAALRDILARRTDSGLRPLPRTLRIGGLR